ncbi:MAG: radical SAM protein [DPANN group archaeon]|nr:radical SAM protein [DPANN group archaeon]
MKTTIYIEDDGCSRRNAELSKLYQYFLVNGFTVVDDPALAGYILLSTCAFKKKEEDHSVRRIRELMDYEAELIIYGCLPDIAPSRFAEFAHLRCLSPKNLDEIDALFDGIRVRYADMTNADMSASTVRATPLPKALKKFWHEFEISSSFFLKTARYAEKRMKKMLNPDERRYNLFICRGCFGGCSYCGIQRAIGPLKSCSEEEILNQLRKGLNEGYRDFVILGDDVGAYGLDRESTFPVLLSRLLQESDAFKAGKEGCSVRFHVEEIHPRWLVKYERELAPVFGSDMISSILCPVQSGSDRVLELMNRGHMAGPVEGILARMRSLNPDILMTTQIMVGFPSETEDDFKATLDFVCRTPFSLVTIFPYHEKENTPSGRIEPKVPDDVIEERVNEAIRYLKRNNVKARLSCI